MANISPKPIYLYNTLTRSKDLFQPLNPPKVGIYSCGPTVYKDIHIGNFRTFVMTDLLRRMLEYNDYDVFLVRNITDVGHLQNDTEERGEDKEAPEDFALWKHGDETRQMNWPSPWGTGFPGWHIECSAMATKYLGEQFDIHTGGIDLVFPHHEDEIAQSQGVSGKPPVRFWVHGEFLDIGNSKMSRSVGNVLLVSTLKEQGIDPMAYRYLLLTAHYRTKLNFTDESITAAQNGLNNL